MEFLCTVFNYIEADGDCMQSGILLMSIFTEKKRLTRFEFMRKVYYTRVNSVCMSIT